MLTNDKLLRMRMFLFLVFASLIANNDMIIPETIMAGPGTWVFACTFENQLNNNPSIAIE